MGAVTRFGEHDAATEALVVEGGASARVDRSQGAPRLQVHDERGALLFEYRPDEGRSVIYAPAGDLELRAESGSIGLYAADAVRIESTRAIDLASEEGVHLEARGRGEATGSRLSLLRRAAVLVAPRLTARAARAELEADEAALTSRLLESAVEHARHSIGTLETKAGRLLERAGESYREVEGLAQTRAGRLRLVADKTLHILGRRTLLKAYEDMKLRAEKVYIA